MKTYKRGIIMFALIAAILFSSVYTAPTAVADASDYLQQYVASVTKSGTTLKVEFYVVGTGVLSKIGASTIGIFESTNGTSWTRVATYYSSTTTSMLRSNYYVHDSSISHTGAVSGRQYYAIVTFFGSNANGSDSKDYATNIITW